MNHELEREQILANVLLRDKSFKESFGRALQEAVLSTPYSMPSILRTGRASAVAPNEKEIIEEMNKSGLTRLEAWNKLEKQNIDRMLD